MRYFLGLGFASFSSIHLTQSFSTRVSGSSAGLKSKLTIFSFNFVNEIFNGVKLT